MTCAFLLPAIASVALAQAPVVADAAPAEPSADHSDACRGYARAEATPEEIRAFADRYRQPPPGETGFLFPASFHVGQRPFPMDLLRSGTEGEVLLLVAYSAQGEIIDLLATCSDDKRLVRHAEQYRDAIRITPASQGGKSLPGAVYVPVRFKL